jgi:spore germination protein GerM
MTYRPVAASLLLLTLAALLAGGCGDANQPTATLYLKRNIETSQPGPVFHVLAPVVRAVPENEDAPTRVLEELLRGPTAAEAEDGFVPTLGQSIEVLGVRVSNGVATVNFGDHAPEDFFAQGAVVLSLTDLPGIRAVALRSNGKPCCVYNFESEPLATPFTRSLYHGWSGEPCALRTYAGAIACEFD